MLRFVFPEQEMKWILRYAQNDRRRAQNDGEGPQDDGEGLSMTSVVPASASNFSDTGLLALTRSTRRRRDGTVGPEPVRE